MHKVYRVSTIDDFPQIKTAYVVSSMCKNVNLPESFLNQVFYFYVDTWCGELMVYSSLVMKFQNCVHAATYNEITIYDKAQSGLLFQSSKDHVKSSTWLWNPMTQLWSPSHHTGDTGLNPYGRWEFACIPACFYPRSRMANKILLITVMMGCCQDLLALLGVWFL